MKHGIHLAEKIDSCGRSRVPVGAQLPHELAVISIVAIVALRAAPEDARWRLALFVDVVDDDGGLEAFPVFALHAFKETERHGEFDVVAVGCFFC